MPNKRLERLRQGLANIIENPRSGWASVIRGDSYDGGVPLFNGPTIHEGRLLSWSGRELTEEDKYKGYAFAAITLKANKVALLGEEHVKTRLADRPDEEYEGDQHPYLPLIDSSPRFDNSFFWYSLSHYLDLQGRFYLLAVRTVTEDTVGAIQELQILNPYNVQRIKKGTGELGGYVEVRDGVYREIPKEMVIEGRTFNPFNSLEGYPRINAAASSQTLAKESHEYTKDSIKNNRGQRGIVTTDVVMEDDDFDRFKARLKSTDVGDFMVGNGPNSLNYTDTQIDLDKLALEAIKNMTREELFAITGGSKTMFGIEESGTTRETARVQQEILISEHAIPACRIIISALNQDYRNHYEKEWQSSRKELFIDSPLKSDAETELKSAQVVKERALAAKAMVDAGYDPTETLKVVGIENEVPYVGRPATTVGGQLDEKLEDNKAEASRLDSFEPELQQVVRGQQATLQNGVINWQNGFYAEVFKRLRTKLDKNAVSSEDDLLSKTEQEKQEKALAALVAVFGLTVLNVFGGQTMKARFKEFGLAADFKVDTVATKAVKDHAKLVATSHVDMLRTQIYETTRKLVAEGKGYTEVVSTLTTQFNKDVVTWQATRLARSETDRFVNTSQYQADRQFLSTHGLTERAYKRWETFGDNPCPMCQALDGTEVAFGENFVELGDSVEADITNPDGSTTTRYYSSGLEPIASGNAHPNCSCAYVLVIKRG